MIYRNVERKETALGRFCERFLPERYDAWSVKDFLDNAEKIKVPKKYLPPALLFNNLGEVIVKFNCRLETAIEVDPPKNGDFSRLNAKFYLCDLTGSFVVGLSYQRRLLKSFGDSVTNQNLNKETAKMVKSAFRGQKTFLHNVRIIFNTKEQIPYLFHYEAESGGNSKIKPRTDKEKFLERIIELQTS